MNPTTGDTPAENHDGVADSGRARGVAADGKSAGAASSSDAKPKPSPNPDATTAALVAEVAQLREVTARALAELERYRNNAAHERETPPESAPRSRHDALPPVPVLNGFGAKPMPKPVPKSADEDAETGELPPLPAIPGTAFAPEDSDPDDGEGDLAPDADAGDFDAPPEEVVPVPAEDAPVVKILPKKVSRFQRWMRRFGWDGFLVSVAAHILIIILASTWIIAQYVITPSTPEKFNTGAGGGTGGDRVREFEHRVRTQRPRDLAQHHPRIASRSPDTSVSLPDLSQENFGLRASGARAGGATKGLGGGSGGGIGKGIGIGVGGDRNFVAKFVLGTPVRAKKIAVYLDSSGSMHPYLPLVKKEIYEQFPDADVFEVNAIGTSVRDGKVVGGRHYKFPPRKAAPVKRPAPKTATAAAASSAPKSSATRTAILRKWDAHFNRGSVGAWMDIMLWEKYDALVIFSDFEDGVHQWNAKGEKIVLWNQRTPAELAWEKRWLDRCAEKNAPRIYLFSIEVHPQSIWLQCAQASGGEVKMVRHLRKVVQAQGAAATTATSKGKTPPAKPPATPKTPAAATEKPAPTKTTPPKDSAEKPTETPSAT